MSFYKEYSDYKEFNFDAFFASITDFQIERILAKDNLNELDYLTLLSPAAEKHLEAIAQKANRLTINQFGRSILLYTPMYLSNYCVNHCIYCGFNAKNDIGRKQLSYDEVDREAKRISESGLKHILILTGEAKSKAGIEYLSECCKILSKYFTSISIEIYPLSTDEYEQLIDAGVDSMTIYQETYSEGLYDKLHLKGPKKDYMFRIDAPERAAEAKMRSVNIGALLGLDEWRRESFITGLHADYLQNKYTDMEVSVSFPRMRPHTGAYEPEFPVNDKNLVQIIMALRLYMPRAGITISTREKADFRDNVVNLGVTKMSAGVTTAVGGHTEEEESTGQFEISDERSVEEMAVSLRQAGFQPIYKDWHPLG